MPIKFKKALLSQYLKLQEKIATYMKYANLILLHLATMISPANITMIGVIHAVKKTILNSMLNLNAAVVEVVSHQDPVAHSSKQTHTM